MGSSWQAVRREIDSDITDFQRYDVSRAGKKVFLTEKTGDF